MNKALFILGLSFYGLTAMALPHPNLDKWNNYVECQVLTSQLTGQNDTLISYFPGPDMKAFQQFPLQLNKERSTASTTFTMDLLPGKQLIVDIQALTIFPGSVFLNGMITAVEVNADGSKKVVQWGNFDGANDGPDKKRVYTSKQQFNPLVREDELNQYMPAHGGQSPDSSNDLVREGMLPAGTVYLYELSCLYLAKGNHR